MRAATKCKCTFNEKRSNTSPPVLAIVWLDQKTRDRLSTETTPVDVPKATPVMLYFERRPARCKNLETLR